MIWPPSLFQQRTPPRLPWPNNSSLRIPLVPSFLLKICQIHLHFLNLISLIVDLSLLKMVLGHQIPKIVTTTPQASIAEGLQMGYPAFLHLSFSYSVKLVLGFQDMSPQAQSLVERLLPQNWQTCSSLVQGSGWNDAPASWQLSEPKDTPFGLQGGTVLFLLSQHRFKIGYLGVIPEIS